MKNLIIQSAAFQRDAQEKTTKWDREWCNYFQEDYASLFFFSMNSQDRKLWITTDELLNYKPRDFYFASPFGKYSFEVWTNGVDVIGRNVLELGCGPGAFGKAVSKVAKRYVGIDYSPLALYIAKLVSPENTEYFHITDIGNILSLRATMDIVVARHFFIHQNAANVEWILELYNFALKLGCKAVLDFWLHPVGPPVKGATIRDGMGELSPHEASCVYYFAPNVIHKLVEDAGFQMESEEEVPEVDRRFVTIRKIRETT